MKGSRKLKKSWRKVTKGKELPILFWLDPLLVRKGECREKKRRNPKERRFLLFSSRDSQKGQITTRKEACAQDYRREQKGGKRIEAGLFRKNVLAAHYASPH